MAALTNSYIGVGSSAVPAHDGKEDHEDQLDHVAPHKQRDHLHKESYRQEKTTNCLVLEKNRPSLEVVGYWGDCINWWCVYVYGSKITGALHKINVILSWVGKGKPPFMSTYTRVL